MFFLPANFLLAAINPLGSGFVLLAFPLLTVFVIFILRLLFNFKNI